MIKIGIYCNDSTQKKEIKKFMLQYFKDLEINAEIKYMKTKSIVLKKMF